MEPSSPPVRVEMTGAVLDAIEAHARADAPRECCGLLVGRRQTTGEHDAVPSLVVERAVPTRNLAPEPSRYLIDPADHFRLLRDLRDVAAADAAAAAGAAPGASPAFSAGVDRVLGSATIVGAYHSHPGSPPVPSATDLANDLGGASPHFLYVITSPRRGGSGSDTRAWWLMADGRAGNFREIPIVPVP